MAGQHGTNPEALLIGDHPVPWTGRAGYPAGSVVAIVTTRGDARSAAAALLGAGVPDDAIEIVETVTDDGLGDHRERTDLWLVVVRQPARDMLVEIRRVLRAAQVSRARYYRGTAIEEIVRTATAWPTSA